MTLARTRRRGDDRARAHRRAPFVARSSCRACGAPDLQVIHAFGEVALANALLTPHGLEYDEPRFPMTLVLCPSCTLLQLRETVAPGVLFADYPYFSSYATTTLDYAEALADDLVRQHRLDGSSLVIEVGSNDGYLLRPLQGRGVGVLGIEPATNVAAVAIARGVPTENAFFGRDLAATLRLRGVACDLLIANNVLAHVADLPGFVAAAASLLLPHGHVVFEFPYVGELLAKGEFDTVYHEHLCYFSLTAVQRLLSRHDLHLTAVEPLARHGGSLRVTAGRQAPAHPDAHALALLATETAAGYDRPEAYAAFVAGIHRTATGLQACLQAAAARGQRVAAYGGSAKGSTLMQVCGVRREQLLFVADRSPHKQGRYTPGNHVRIVAPEQILAEQPDLLLLLAWNFADEILQQQTEYRRRGGRFLLPVPEVALL